MPYKIRSRKCRQSDGTQGTHAVVKLKDGSEEQTSCHTSEDSAEGSIRARHANEAIMRISESELIRIIKEEAHDCVKDYRLGTLTRQEYEDCLKRFEEPDDYGYNYRKYPPRKTSYVGADSNQDKIAAVQAAMEAKPNNFLQSVLSQLQRGRGLSRKQNAIVKKILAKSNPESAKLFENAPARPGASMRIKKSELKQIIQEAIERPAQDLTTPVRISDLQYVDDGNGAMMLPGVGYSYSVREKDFEAEKQKLKDRYGDDAMISTPDPRYPKVKKIHSAKFDRAQSRENQNFMRNQAMMRKRLGREPGLGS